jgi:ABC-type branched-subunit amino acid transport system ATPase component
VTGELSGGQQRMVEIGRTLMSEPRMLLVDEPTAGLSKMLANEVYAMLKDLSVRDGLTILLVDQEIRQALRSPTTSMSSNWAGTSSKARPPSSPISKRRSGWPE